MPRLAIALICVLSLLGYYLAAAAESGSGSSTSLDGQHSEAQFFLPGWPFPPTPKSGGSHTHMHKSGGTPKELVVGNGASPPPNGAKDGQHSEGGGTARFFFPFPAWHFPPKPKSGGSHAPKSSSSHTHQSGGSSGSHMHKSGGTPKELFVESALPLNGNGGSPPQDAKDGQHGETARFFFPFPGWPFAPKPKSGGSHAPKSDSSHMHKSGGSPKEVARFFFPFPGWPFPPKPNSGGSHAPKSGSSHTHKSDGSSNSHMHKGGGSPKEVVVASTLPLKGDGASPAPKVGNGGHNSAKGDHGASRPHHHRKIKHGAGHRSGSPKHGH